MWREQLKTIHNTFLNQIRSDIKLDFVFGGVSLDKQYEISFFFFNWFLPTLKTFDLGLDLDLGLTTRLRLQLGQALKSKMNKIGAFD